MSDDTTDKPNARAALREVATLYKSNARDIPAMLRKLADDLEQPPKDTDRVDCAVCVIWNMESGRFNTYGWGDTTLDTSIVFLAVAHDELLQVRKRNGPLWKIPHGGVK